MIAARPWPTGDERARNGPVLRRAERLVERQLGCHVERVMVISHTPGRHHVLQVDTDAGAVVVKSFRRRDDAAALFNNLNRLQDEPFDVLRAPGPLAFCAKEAMVVMALLSGQPLTIASDATTIQQAGRALAELHALPLRGNDRHVDLHGQIAELVSPHPAELAAALPAWRAVIDGALGRLTAFRSRNAAVLLHRDFHLRQLLAEGDRVAVVDWDLLAAGDPTFDIVYFTTYLETHHAGDGLGESFLAGYRGNDHSHDDYGAGLDTYRVFNLLRRASRRFRLRDEGWQEELERMLAALEQAL